LFIAAAAAAGCGFKGLLQLKVFPVLVGWREMEKSISRRQAAGDAEPYLGGIASISQQFCPLFSLRI
jgi:hypothetical protein